MADRQILVFSGAQPVQQPANDKLILTGPLDTVTHYVTAAAELVLMPGGNSGIQSSNLRDARGDFSIDLQLSTDADTQVASGSSAMILGGARNTANGIRAMVVGGEDNTTTGQASCILSGDQGSIDAGSVFSVIAGGQNNSLINSDYAFIGSGDTCTANASNNASIGGGVSNDVANSTAGTIAGGSNNDVTGVAGTVCGGQTNAAAGSRAFIGGGRGNICDGDYAGVCSGNGCTVSAAGDYGVVSGGKDNDATALYAACVGGLLNVASGNYATCLGGNDCEAQEQYSSALGWSAVATHNGEFAFCGSDSYLSPGDSQWMLLTLRRATSNATPRFMYTDGAADTLTLPANTSWTFDILVNGFKTDGSATAGYRIQGVIYRDGSGNVTFAGGTPTTTVIAETDATWDCVVEANVAAQALDIKVTGSAATAINWTAKAEIVQNTVAL